MIRTYVVNNQPKGQIIINPTDLKEIGRINNFSDIIRKTIKIDTKLILNKNIDNVTEDEIINYVNSLNLIVKSNELYNIELIELFKPIPNFSIKADWNIIQDYPVTDEQSFRTFLSSRDNWNDTNNLTNIVITDFSLVNNLLECNLSANGTNLDLGNIGISSLNGIGNINNLQVLYLDNNALTSFNITLPNTLLELSLYNNQISNFDPSLPLPNSLTYLDLTNNQISNFDPSLPLPNNLLDLYLTDNQISNFDPSLPLPINLNYLDLTNNQISNFDPSLPLPNNLDGLYLNNNQISNFDPSLPLPSYLIILELQYNQISNFDPSLPLPNNLQYLKLNNNQITEFNPNISLPIILFELNLSNNLISNDVITNMETWANLQNNFSQCIIYFNGNPISSIIMGSNLQTILYNKNASISI